MKSQKKKKQQEEEGGGEEEEEEEEVDRAESEREMSSHNCGWMGGTFASTCTWLADLCARGREGRRPVKTRKLGRKPSAADRRRDE
jgi:hypothetical protein